MLKKLLISSCLIFGLSQNTLAKETNQKQFTQHGVASWYGRQFHGRKTASGETYNMHSLTAAHRTLPLGSIVRVTNKSNGKSVIVKINDRGPFHGNRVIDVSKAAATQLGMVSNGIAKVEVCKLK